MSVEEAYERAIEKLDEARWSFVDVQDFNGAMKARELLNYARDRLAHEKQKALAEEASL